MSSPGGTQGFTRKQQREQAREQRKALEAAAQARAARTRVLLRAGVVLAVAVVVLGVIFLRGSGASNPVREVAGKYPYKIGQPGPGASAPAVELPSTAGGQFSLAAQRGHTVLLYFQEGLDCQPCWTQLGEIQKSIAKFRAVGVEQIVTITSDPLEALSQKVADEGLHLPVLSDSGLVASREYSANATQYTMMGAMGDSRDGHTFVLVGPEGRIRWRADYGGEPNYTMDVPVADLLADLHKGASGAHA